VEGARGFLALANFVHLATLALHTYRLMAGVSDVAMWTAAQLVVALVMMGSAGVLSLLPQLLSHRSVSAMSSFISALLAAFIALGDYAKEGTHEHRGHILATCTFWCAFDLQPRMNAVRMATVFASLVFQANAANEASLGFGIVFAAFYLLLFGIHNMFMKIVRLEIHAMDSGNELSAVKILLGTICDVVVELDSNLRFMQHSPGLAGVLLHGASHSIQGASLQDFLHGEDAQQEILRRLACSSEAATAADVFHAKMRDATGGSVAMELFSVAFHGSDNRRRHLLGMREFTDVAPVMRPLERRWEPAQPPPVVSPRWHGTPAAPEQGEIDAQPPSRAPSRASSLSPSRASSPSPSQASSPRARRSAPSRTASSAGPAERPVRETSHAAKKISLSTTILGWRVDRLDNACCPMHALAHQARRMVGDLLSESCFPEFQIDTGWQCERCGIASDQYRIKQKRHKCLLCKDFHDDAFAPGARGEHVPVPL